MSCHFSVGSEGQVERWWKESVTPSTSVSLHFNQKYFYICLQANPFAPVLKSSSLSNFTADILYHSRVGYLLFFLMYIKVFYSVSQQSCFVLCVFCSSFHNEGRNNQLSHSLIIKLLASVLLISAAAFSVHHCIASSLTLEGILRESHWHRIS